MCPVQSRHAPPDGPPSPRLALALLGRFELSGPQGAINLPGGKLAGLLAYLACTVPRPQSREKIAALFWGSHFDAQAKQNLRQALARLRRMLGPDALQGDGETVWLDESAVDCDVGRFEALIQDGSRDALSAAADLYRGPLVDGVVVREEGFGEWLAGERARRLELALGALIGLGTQELAAGRAEQALQAGRRAIALNTLREDAHRLVVQALVAAGRRAEALRHYQDLAALLKRELNTEPDAVTRALVAGLDRISPQAAVTLAEAPSSASAPERRQLTIMVCRMALASRLDPEDRRDLANQFRARITEVAARFDGVVAQPLDDGASLYFGYPIAREHDTDQAVRAALAIQEAVGERARIGIATGLVVVGAEQPVAIGETPALAARLQALAAPGEVVIAGGTRRLVGRRFDCRASGEAWQVLREAERLSRFEAQHVGALSPLVGRQEEMERLLRRWDQAKSGEGQVVLLSGEAGIGKSRIAESLLAAVGDGAPRPLRYFCSPHHANSPLYPIIAQLERALALEPGGAGDAKLDRLAALLAPVSKTVARDVALLAELLGVPLDARYPALAMMPPQRREATLAALINQIDGAAAQGPLLIVAEDAHWIDPTSHDLLDRMVARIDTLPVLLVVTARPELQPAWIGQPQVTMLPLNRLGRSDGARIMAGIAKDKALPDAMVEQVLGRADGVPLFIEELTSTLLESGLLRETAGRYVLDGPPRALALPATLQASLVERLDRLGPGKDMAVIGAAIGRNFSHELVAQASGLAAPDLDAALQRLVASGLVHRHGMAPDTTYTFKHALVQDAAYATMLRNRRRQLHAAIAEALVTHFAALVESQPEIAARHFTEAERADEAIGYWVKAAQLAQSRSASREAAEFYERALQLLATLPESREMLQRSIDLRFDLKDALVVLGEYERVSRHLHDADRLASRLDDQGRQAVVYGHLCHVHWMMGRATEAYRFGRNALAIAKALGDVGLQIRVNLQLGSACQWRGDYRQAEAVLLTALRQLDEDGGNDRTVPGRIAVAVHIYLAVVLGRLGRFEEGIAHGEAGVRLAEARIDPQSHANACLYVAHLRNDKGDFGPASVQAERALALCRQWNLAMLSASAKAGLGHAYAFTGRVAEGISMMEQALGAFASMRHGAAVPLINISLGQAYSLVGRRGDALECARSALISAREGGQRGNEAKALCLLGTIVAAPDQAEGHLRDALALAEELGMRPLIAHCQLGYGKLYRSAGAHDRAQRHFATAMAIYRDLGMPYWLTQAQAELRDAQPAD